MNRESAGEKTTSSAKDLYIKVLNITAKSQIPFMLGGGMAVYKYTNIRRPTKDLDLFCKAGDYPKILTVLRDSAVTVRVLDERWLAQATEAKHHVDIVFSSPSAITTVDDSWFEHAGTIELFGIKVKIIPREELIWCKAYVQDRNHFDGADVNHIILTSGKEMDWKRLLMRMENHWELLLSLLLNFRFVYPSERSKIPRWLMEELISRLQYQINTPIPRDKICRGPLISRTQYRVDLTKFGFEVIL